MTGLVVDTSAVMAILLAGPEASRMSSLLQSRPDRMMSAATRVELGMVAEGRLQAAEAVVQVAPSGQWQESHFPANRRREGGFPAKIGTGAARRAPSSGGHWP